MSKKIIIGALLLFTLVFLIIGAPWASWWFYESDEFDTLFRAFNTQNIQNLTNFFCFSDIRNTSPDNTHFGGNFFDTFHRPLVLIIDFIRYHFFCLSGLGYHLSNVFFHAINAAIIFFVTATYAPIITALFAGSFFAFHPQIAYSFGRIDCLQYSLNLTLILFMLIFFKRYLDSNSNKDYFITCLLFITSLLLRETAVVMPLILTMGAMVYLPLKSFETSAFAKATVRLLRPSGAALHTTRALWAILFSFLTLRLYLYPISSSSSPIPWLARETTIAKKLYFLYSTTAAIISDFLSLSWFNPDTSGLKTGIVITVLSFFIILFFYNKHKFALLFCLLSTLLILWPAFLTGGYHPRYLYEAMPFVIMFYVIIFNGYNRQIRRTATTFFGLLLTFYLLLTIECFAIKRKNLSIVEWAFNHLVQNHDIKKNPIIFIGTPTKPFGTGLPNLMRIVQSTNPHPIYFDFMLPITNMPLKKNDSILTINNLNNDNAYTIGLDRHGYIHVIGDEELPEIQTKYGECLRTSDSHIVIRINQEILDQNPLIITWDYKENKFKVLNSYIIPAKSGIKSHAQ